MKNPQKALYKRKNKKVNEMQHMWMTIILTSRESYIKVYNKRHNSSFVENMHKRDKST